ncbi:MAG: hypothetical protein IT285_02890 [Bdellovibrionales bacterium]|nr:hypothetical protein [Bdellovibrionales bacterium]
MAGQGNLLIVFLERRIVGNVEEAARPIELAGQLRTAARYRISCPPRHRGRGPGA